MASAFRYFPLSLMRAPSAVSGNVSPTCLAKDRVTANGRVQSCPSSRLRYRARNFTRCASMHNRQPPYRSAREGEGRRRDLLLTSGRARGQLRHPIDPYLAPSGCTGGAAAGGNVAAGEAEKGGKSRPFPPPSLPFCARLYPAPERPRFPARASVSQRRSGKEGRETKGQEGNAGRREGDKLAR